MTGSVDFQLQLATGADGTTYCLGPGTSCDGDDWLSILTADGGDDLNLVGGCVADCTDCQPIACSNICAIASPLGDAGAHTTWDGTYVQPGSCGPSALTCSQSECAPAGSYIARMCGYARPADAGALLGCMGGATPTCVNVPFVWPPPSGSSVVQGEIGGDD